MAVLNQSMICGYPKKKSVTFPTAEQNLHHVVIMRHENQIFARFLTSIYETVVR